MSATNRGATRPDLDFYATPAWSWLHRGPVVTEWAWDTLEGAS